MPSTDIFSCAHLRQNGDQSIPTLTLKVAFDTLRELQVGQKSKSPKCSTHNFVKYWPIFKILHC